MRLLSVRRSVKYLSLVIHKKYLLPNTNVTCNIDGMIKTNGEFGFRFDLGTHAVLHCLHFQYPTSVNRHQNVFLQMIFSLLFDSNFEQIYKKTCRFSQKYVLVLNQCSIMNEFHRFCLKSANEKNRLLTELLASERRVRKLLEQQLYAAIEIIGQLNGARVDSSDGANFHTELESSSVTMDTEDRKRTECTKCTRSFSNKSNLRQHVVTFHAGLRYNCDFCTKNFTRKSNLLKHVKTTHFDVTKN